MQDVIQKIISTENEAKHAVEAAKAEADSITTSAQKQGHDVIERARQEARIESEKIVEAAVEAAEREKQDRLTRAVAEIESQIRLEPDSRERAAEGVVRCVCRQP